MKLYLMRHGQAASPEVDPQRGLTSTGRMAIEQLATRLAEQGISFSQAFHSGKARAEQTAQIMATILAPAIMLQANSGLNPNDDPKAILAEIESWQDDTLVASHLPFVPGLLAELTGQGDYRVQGMGFVPGTIICLEKEDNGWKTQWIESP
jgi:phosphohistidine phosphatase